MTGSCPKPVFAGLLASLFALAVARAQVEWTQAPLPMRSGHAMAHDPVGMHMLAFGGFNSIDTTSRASTLVWQDGHWRELAPASSPPGRTDHAMVTAFNRILLFGGADNTGGSLADTWEWDGLTWTQRQPANRPPARHGHALAYDASRGRVVLFGGQSGSSLLADTWEWDGTNWQPQNPVAAPPARAGHTMTNSQASGLTFLFGGGSFGSTLDDLWTWDGVTWQLQTPRTGNRPSPRGVHAMGYDPRRDRVIVMGGSAILGVELADLWEWDHGNSRWIGTSATGPRRRSGHAMAFDPQRQRLMMFGGCEQLGRGCFTDTWAWDGASWTNLGTDSPPGPRFDSAMTFDAAAGTVVLFGGRGDFDDTWTWNGQRWTERFPFNRPPPRSGHMLAYDPVRGRTLLFGGGSADTWEWDGRDWLSRSPARSPPARLYAAMAADPGRGRIVLFGGSRDAGGLLADLWEWDGSDWQARGFFTRPVARRFHAMAYDPVRRVTVMFGGLGTPGAMNDTWEWDGVDWTRRLPQPAPRAREGHAMVYDTARKRVVLFGGHDGTTLYDDTWEWDGETWAQRLPAIKPAPALSRAMAFDTARGRAVVYAGSDPHPTWEYGPTNAAVFRPFGFGCAGSNGTPVLTAAPFALPWRGEIFGLEVGSAPPGRPAAIALGVSDAQWGGVGLPFDLALLGMPGCKLYASTELVLAAANVTGTARLHVAIPDDAALIGGTFFAQGLLIDPGTNAAGLIVSNAAAGTIGGL